MEQIKLYPPPIKQVKLPDVKKESLNDLAVFGNPPAFAEPLHVGRPNIGDREYFQECVNDILDRRWLSNGGPYVREFEREIERRIGVKHCIAMCNGTVALEIAIRALGLKGEVIVPSMTFVATAHALKWQEITPVFCDVDEETLTLDPEEVKRHITPNTTGIIGVHLWGRPCDVDGLKAVSDAHGLKLMFDAAHAFGCSYKSGMIGSFGDLEVFSFHPTKFINALEGGAVVTNDDELAEKIRLMKNFGFSDTDKVTYIGTNGKMNEVSAAAGLSSLKVVNKFIEANYANYKAYENRFKSIPGVKLVKYNEEEYCNYQYIAILIDETKMGMTRDELVMILNEENVLARRYFYPGCHKMEPYKSLYPNAGLMLPKTEDLLDRIILLPTGTAINTGQIERIVDIIEATVPGNDSPPLPVTPKIFGAETVEEEVSESNEPQTLRPALINSLPKSGTHLLKKLLDLAPELEFSGVQLHNQVEFGANGNGSVRMVEIGVDAPVSVPYGQVERMLGEVGNGQYVFSHIKYSDEMDEIVRSLGLKSVVILRDPRDVVASHANFISKTESHFLHELYKQLKPEERLIASIVGLEKEAGQELWLLDIATRYRSMLGWQGKGYNYTTRFEALIGEEGLGDRNSQQDEINGILTHLGLKQENFDTKEITANLFGDTHTFNQGRIGNWKEVFSEKVKDIFKPVAGELLVELGYEKDNNW